jgi:very-short-patch-repair endonuclease
MESGLCRITKGLPGPGAQPQFEVVAAANRYYIDFAYPHVRLGIEAQSLKWHMGRVRWQYDLVRDRRLKSVGWTLLYFSWDDIRLDPKGVAEEVLRVRTALELTLF